MIASLPGRVRCALSGILGGFAINAEATLIKPDDTAPPVPARQPRAIGRLMMSARLRAGASRIGDLHQQGSFKALFPRTPGAALQAVSLNTAGGVTGGDRFALSARVQSGAHLVMTTQAAERMYRAQPGETGAIHNQLSVADEARLDWLPQETIVFDGARVQRRMDVDMSGTARFLAVEPLVFGRLAMGETLQSGHFTDQWRLRRDGRLIFADNLRLTGAIADVLRQPGVANGAGAMASLVLAAPDADLWCDRLRGLLGPNDGVSLIRPGVLFARLLAQDSFVLRQVLIPAIQALSGADIPKTWTL